MPQTTQNPKSRSKATGIPLAPQTVPTIAGKLPKNWYVMPMVVVLNPPKPTK